MSDTYVDVPQAAVEAAMEKESRQMPNVDLDRLSEDESAVLVEAALDRMKVEQLSAVIETAQEKRRKRHDEARDALLRRFREDAASLGLQVSLSPIGSQPATQSGRRSRRDSGAPVAPKFRGPHGEEWSGRGRLPRWLSALEAEGRHRDDYRIA